MEALREVMGEETWANLHEEEKDKIIDDAFTVEDVKRVTYTEASWGGMVVRSLRLANRGDVGNTFV